MIGLSGFHSKDYIIAQDLSFWSANPRLGGFFFYAALLGAGLTAFYMFRLWYMTFAGNPRDGHVYYHAHESPKLDDRAADDSGVFRGGGGVERAVYRLGAGAALAAGPAGGNRRGRLRRAVLAGRDHAGGASGHATRTAVKAEWAAFGVALAGFILATLFYGLRKLDPMDVRRTFLPVYRVPRPQMDVRRIVRLLFRPAGAENLRLGRRGGPQGDRLAGGQLGPGGRRRLPGWTTGSTASFVDSAVNLAARWTYALGLRLRTVQTGSIRQYVLWIAVGTVGLFVLMSLYWNYAVAVVKSR